MKIGRLALLGRVVDREFKRMVERHGVFAVRVGGGVVPEPAIQSLLNLIYLAFVVNFASCLALSALGIDVLTSISAVAASMFNIGPGLGGVGPLGKLRRPAGTRKVGAEFRHDCGKTGVLHRLSHPDAVVLAQVTISFSESLGKLQCLLLGRRKTMTRTAVNPWDWSLQFGFNQGELIEGGKRVLYCSGQTCLDENAKPQHVDDIRGQITASLDNLEAVLAKADMSLSNVVRLTVLHHRYRRNATKL